MNSHDKYIETIRASSYLIGVRDGLRTSPLRNITLLALLSETNCLTSNDGTPIPQSEIDDINSIAVIWYNENDEMHIHQVYNFATGEIYWDFDSIGTMDWTNNDDKLVGSLIMFGGLE